MPPYNNRLAIAGRLDEGVRYVYQILERAQKKMRDFSESTGRNITQIVVVADGSGYSIRQHACLACKFRQNFNSLSQDKQLSVGFNHSTLCGLNYILHFILI
jgi:hypothetical protein